MTYPAHESRVQIGRVHSMAICKEIGERLRTRLDQESVRLPRRLLILIKRLRGARSRNSANRRA
jgi:hypothetical protein